MNMKIRVNILPIWEDKELIGGHCRWENWSGIRYRMRRGELTMGVNNGQYGLSPIEWRIVVPTECENLANSSAESASTRHVLLPTG